MKKIASGENFKGGREFREYAKNNDRNENYMLESIGIGGGSEGRRGDLPYPEISVPRPNSYSYHSIPGKIIGFPSVYPPKRMRVEQQGDLFL